MRRLRSVLLLICLFVWPLPVRANDLVVQQAEQALLALAAESGSTLRTLPEAALLSLLHDPERARSVVALLARPEWRSDVSGRGGLRVALERFQALRSGSSRPALSSVARACTDGTCDLAPVFDALRQAAAAGEASDALMDGIAPFFQPDVGYDARTGLSLDGVDIGPDGEGTSRRHGAPSKESLHLILLVQAVRGDPLAMRMIAPADPASARAVAEEILQRKIATYERFHERFPEFGGFLPWYYVPEASGPVVPMEGWQRRVPALDNGQLAWSIYYTWHALREAGVTDLAERYHEALQRMQDHVVPMFFDERVGQLVTEAPVVGSSLPAEQYLDDPYEGILMVHFADLFGTWPTPLARERLWRAPRRIPHVDGTALGEVDSTHEDWALLILPFLDVDVARAAFNQQWRARLAYVSEHGHLGPMAAAHHATDSGVVYRSLLGTPPLGQVQPEALDVYAGYASFSLALVDRAAFEATFSRVATRPGMMTRFGLADSVDSGGHVSPIVTFDGNALPVIGAMGGVQEAMGRYLREDGLYADFLARVRSDYGLFERGGP